MASQAFENLRGLYFLMPFHLPISPLQIISEHPGEARGISLFIKRDDLLHPEIQGSKARKLAALFPQVKISHPGGVLTFGGAFSNHLHAVAVAGRIFGTPTFGILRGEYADFQNPTLRACQENGMTLLRWPKVRYDACKDQASDLISNEFPQCFFLPEGGNTPQAAEACTAISKEITAQLPTACLGKPLYLCTPAGTGCTASGIVAGLEAPNSQVLIFPVSSHGFSRQTILRLGAGIGLQGSDLEQRFSIVPNYIFGGFAKLHPPALEFARSFFRETNILLDPIYTAKMMFGIFDLLAQGGFAPDSTVVALHTGGMQGWSGFRARFGEAGSV